MHKSFYRTVGVIACAFTICMQTPAYAVNEVNMMNTPSLTTEDYEVSPYADVIVLKTRIHNGKPQYRHWNETRGYWVEPDWVDMEAD
ncbi:MAG: hypothetical protein HFH26_04555 [Clostridiaceae bacterium]|nr:hypothetical protein [Clostridiaceae bacterium]